MNEAIDRSGWYQIITAFPNALTTVGWLRENGEWFIPDPTFNEASVVGAKLSRLIPENEILEPTGVLYWQDAENELRATQSRLDKANSNIAEALAYIEKSREIGWLPMWTTIRDYLTRGTE